MEAVGSQTGGRGMVHDAMFERPGELRLMARLYDHPRWLSLSPNGVRYTGEPIDSEGLDRQQDHRGLDAGLGLNELRELRQLREENNKLKRLVVDLSLDRHILQEIVAKKALKPRNGARWRSGLNKVTH